MKLLEPLGFELPRLRRPHRDLTRIQIVTPVPFAFADDMCCMSQFGPDREVHRLPPLILHPFSSTADSCSLLDSTRASLMRLNVAPANRQHQEAERSVLEGRHREIRMLFYIGKDVVRWIEQCLESLARPLGMPEIRFQSFAELLTRNPPANVAGKMHAWGVVDFKRVFSRALALNSVFTEFPALETLSPTFIRHYHGYVDQMFSCLMSAEPYGRLDPAQFPFDLYSSAEYSELLERGL